MSLEIQMITRRDVPKEIVETFNKQTSKDFTMKILNRGSQKWSVDDLEIDFPLKVIPQKLFYSSGTQYALCLARNELLCQAESDYVLVLDDYVLVSPVAVKQLIPHLHPNRVIRGIKKRPKETWNGAEQYERLLGHLRGSSGELLGAGWTHFTTGCDLFPMEALKRVNGWDLKLDGEWGCDDRNVALRLKLAGVEFSQIRGVKSMFLGHIGRSGEKGDPRHGEGDYIYNVETGRRRNFLYLRSPSGGLAGIRERDQYNMDTKDAYAPVGLKEVYELLK